MSTTETGHRGDRPVPFDEHLQHVLAQVRPLQPIEIGLVDAVGLVLAEDVIADHPVPARATITHSGYAVATGELDDATGYTRLTLVEAGDHLPSGSAVLVSPGDDLPRGADAVVPRERATVEGAYVHVARVAAETGVRAAGSDMGRGARVLAGGRRLRPADVAVLAAVGRSRVRCHPPPRVVVVAAGSELVDVEARSGTVRDSNGPMLLALLRSAGAVTFWAGSVPDDRRRLIDAFDSNLGHADLFVAAGGTALRNAISMLGDVRIADVAMEPGRMQLWGSVRGVPVLGLPGHPAGAFVSFESIVLPVLRRLQGRQDLHRPRIGATLQQAVHRDGHSHTYLRVRLERTSGGWVAHLAGGQDPHDLRSLAAADGLAVLVPGEDDVPAGTPVEVHLLVEP